MNVEVSLPNVYSWESQVCQYRDAPRPAPEDLPCITYFEGEIPGLHPVDCLLAWVGTTSGRPMIAGILNHYPVDYDLEKAGNVNIWVRARNQRQGIGSALWREAQSRWSVALDQQRFTAPGAALANSLLGRPAGPGRTDSKG